MTKKEIKLQGVKYTLDQKTTNCIYVMTKSGICAVSYKKGSTQWISNRPSDITIPIEALARLMFTN